MGRGDEARNHVNVLCLVWGDIHHGAHGYVKVCSVVPPSTLFQNEFRLKAYQRDAALEL
jgi:hypothetical protein